MLCCPARFPRSASSCFPGGTFKLSSVTAAFKIASFLNALRCKSAGRRRLLPDCHSLSVSLSRKLAIIRHYTNAVRYYCQEVVFGNAVGFDQSPYMSLFCDVALAVPLDMVFTYAIPPGMEAVVGGRVLVPFRQQRMSGIVVELHDRPPQVKTQQIKKVIEALDLSPVLDEQLLKLGKWIADYYLAPVGEVFRTMLPLSAEFKRAVEYRITDEGRMALHLAGMSGSPARSKRTPEQQLVEFRVLDYLAERESVREERLRGATRVAKALLSGMVRKKWIAREDMSAARDAARLVKVAVLLATETGVTGSNESDDGAPGVPARQDGPAARHHTNSAKKLNENQRTLIETLAGSGGRIPVEALRTLDVPRTTLGTLVRRGLIELVDEPQDFTAFKLKPRPSPFAL